MLSTRLLRWQADEDARMYAFELANETNLTTRQTVYLLQLAGAPARHAVTTVRPEQADAVRAALRVASLSGLVDPKDAGSPRGRAKRMEIARDWLEYKRSGLPSIRAWKAAKERERRALASRKAAAATSKAITEREAAIRRAADRQRWEGTFEGPTTVEDSRPTIYLAGAPGLGKRR